MAKFDKKLASILLSRELVDENICREMLEKSKSEDTGLTAQLIEAGVLTELEIIEVTADEMQIAPINLDLVTVPDELLEILSEEMATYYSVVPVSSIGNILTVAVSNPYDILALDDLKIVTGCELIPVLSTDTAIARNIIRCYKGDEPTFNVDDLLDESVDPDLEIQENVDIDEDVDIESAIADGNDAPVVKLVNLVLFQAINDRVSDIHIEAFEKKTRIRYRLDGACYESLSVPKRMHSSIVSRIKVMSGMDIAERRRPQDAKFQLKVKGRQVDFRVSVLPCIHGEKVVIRILDSSNLSLSLESLGFEQQCLEQFSYAIKQPYGMILVTGPTGSGKSTTLYSSVKEVMCIEENITTVEDPVEYQLMGVNQVQVSEKRGLTFAGALRSILRQDPDTVMIGEIRDLETVEIAVKAALTGHRVFSTLHTNDAPSTITRMIDMGVDPFMISSAVLLVAAQRLARKLCDECKAPVDVNPEMLLLEGFTEEEINSNTAIYQSVGCEKCDNKGYKGRFALLETMPVTDEIKTLIINGASALDLRKKALEEGMITLRRAGLMNVLRGRTTIEEIMRITLRD